MRVMIWKNVRLELARTADFPKGSASRAYLLRVPLDDEGQIDGVLIERSPSQATARRFWASEPDQFGYVERADGDWVLRCRGQSGELLFRMPSSPLRLNGLVMIKDPDGTSKPFRVASIRTNGRV